MKFDPLRVLITLALLTPILLAFGQETFPERVDQMYGLDKDLVNGIQYYNRHLRSQGHPYFLSDRFSDGSVSIKGKLYQAVSLKYDLFQQDLELEYEAFTGGKNRLILIQNHVDSFSLGDYKFWKREIGDLDPAFYQVIALPQFRCLIYWKKNMVPLSNSTIYTQEFTKSRKTFWLESRKTVRPFHNRRSFVAFFPEDKQKEIRKIFRQQSFSFRRSQPADILRAMQAVSDLLEGGGAP